MADYKSKKITRVKSKVRTDKRPVKYVKSTDFIPQVFNTELNRKWLDTTFNQMLNKAPLEDLDAYAGSRFGGHRTVEENYLSEYKLQNNREQAQFSPAIVSEDADGKLANIIAFDDVAYNINQAFEQYKYNSAYSTDSYVYKPPIDVDKFVNYLSYYWVPDIPEYKSKNVLGEYDIFSEINGKQTHLFDDGTNQFELQNGMLIRLHEGYGELTGTLIKVTGVGKSIKLIKIADQNNRLLYPKETVYTAVMGDEWSESQNVFTFSRTNRQGQTAHNQQNPIDVINDYNNAINRAPLIELFLSEVGRLQYISVRTIIRFDDTWPGLTEAEKADVYVLDILKNGDIKVTKVLEGVDNTTEILQRVPTGLSNDLEEIAHMLQTVDAWDSETWDYSEPDLRIKDYLVSAMDDPAHTAWTRVNNWIHVDTLRTLDKIIPGFDFSYYKNQERCARRHIIEYQGGMEFWKSGANWQGIVHYMFAGDAPTDNRVDNIAVGDVIAFANSNILYTVDDLQGNISQSITLQDNDSFFLLQNEDRTIVNQDMYYHGGIEQSQIKHRPNQPQQFNLYSYEGLPIQSYPDTVFDGNSIFSYAIGTTQDKELDMSVKIKDSKVGPEFVFENYIVTNRAYSSLETSTGATVGDLVEIQGLYYYKQDGNLKSIYVGSDFPQSASKHLQQEIKNDYESAVFSVGHADWRSDNHEYLVTYDHGTVSVTELWNDGVLNNKLKANARITVPYNTEIKIHDLLPDAQLDFFDIQEGTTLPGVTITRTVDEITVILDPTVDYPVLFGTSLQDACYITGTVYNDEEYHKVYVDGIKLSQDQYTLTANQITVPASIVKTDSIVDLYYYHNDKQDTRDVQIPDVQKQNANNETFNQLTLGETLNHWLSIIESVPGMSGDKLGVNNYHMRPNTRTHGGEIFIHTDTSVGHDINYADPRINVTHILTETGKDWDAFKKRFETQVRRLVSSIRYNSVEELVTRALQDITLTRKGTDYYKHSNMVFASKVDEERFAVKQGVLTYTSKHTFNSDNNIKDHVYVYLIEDGVKRILVKGYEFDLTAGSVVLKSQPADGSTLLVQYYPMDSECYVPTSLTKLGLHNVYIPKTIGTSIIGHDGSRYELSGSTELSDVNSADFNAVGACLLELERRIYCGLVTDTDKYTNAEQFWPSQHRSTWYDIDDLNDYVKRFYLQYSKSDDFGSPDVFDNDGWTWNYSTVKVAGHPEFNLPGHYKGCYYTLFGTSTPAETPWQILGFAKIPDWWYDFYSWTDVNKRTAMLKAFKYGIVSKPGTPLRQDLNYARYYWDWDTKSPVALSGVEVAPKDVIIPVNEGINDSDKFKPFVFGDWSPVELTWRQSSRGQAAMLDAVIKANPARAWTQYFQPGSIKDYSVGGYNIKLNEVTKMPITMSDFRHAGEQDTLTLTGVKVVNSAAYTNVTANILSTETYYGANTTVDTDENGKITKIALNGRGYGYTKQPYVDIVTSDENMPYPNLDVVTAHVPHVANGISQAQFNITRKEFNDVDFVQMYDTLDTRAILKLSGYTNKNLLSLTSDSSRNGKFRIQEQDYDLVLYKGAPWDILGAIDITVTKLDSGYRIDGLSFGHQRIKFYEPVTVGKNAFTEVDINNAVIRKYRNLQSQESVLELGTKVNKLQDVYNIIRGHRMYLESKGVEFSDPTDAVATAVVAELLRSDVDSQYLVDVGESIKFNISQGFVSEFNTLPNLANVITGTDERQVSKHEFSVNRTEDTVEITPTQQDYLISNAHIALVDYEHAIVFKNKTEFGITIFDDVKSQSIQRVKVVGSKTKDWTGAVKAPGYLVIDNKIVENFDSSVDALRDSFDNSAKKFNNSIEESSQLLVGNIDKQWAKDLDINTMAFNKFYQGLIKQKGTNQIIDRINRTTKHKGTLVDFDEEMMFRHSYIGNTDRQQSTEFTVKQENFTFEPQTFYLAENEETQTGPYVEKLSPQDSRYVFKGNHTSTTIDYEQFENKSLLTAGELRDSEADFKIFDLNALPSVFDSESDYANIETWDETTSYKRGDLVRYQGSLYKLMVPSIGFTEVTEEIVRFGTNTFTQYASGTQVNIDGQTLNLQKTAVSYNDIVATAQIATPTVPFGTQLSIDGESVQFGTVGTTTIKNVSADFNGDPYHVGNVRFSGGVNQVLFSDVTGKDIIINGITVNFDTTPSDVSETFTSANTGTAPIILAQDTFTVSQSITPTGYGVSSVTVNGTNSAFTTNGQQVTVTGNISVGDSVRVTLSHVPDQMTVAQAITKIQTSVSGVLSGLDSNGLLYLHFDTPDSDTSSNLTVAGGTALNDLGFAVGNYVPSLIQAPIQTAAPLSDVVSIINNRNIPNITAGAAGNNLVITKQLNGQSGILSLAGDLAVFGLTSTYTPSSTTINVSLTATEAVQQINSWLTTNGNSAVTASVEDNRIVITSTANTLDLGNSASDNFVGISGLPAGIHTSTGSVVANTPPSQATTEWADISTEDEALFSVWTVDDNLLEYDVIDGIKTKHNGWNLLQVMHKTALYPRDDNDEDGCAICAGSATKDGNDARIRTPVSHDLQVGDYVMLVNTTTVPNTDGIHKVTRIGSELEFYIDMFIEKCGTAPTLFTIRPVRFETTADMETARTNNKWYWNTGQNVFANRDNGVRGAYVHTVSEAGEFSRIRTKTNYVNNDSLKNVVIYDGKKQQTQVVLEVFDPLRGIIPGAADRNIDFKTPVDLAAYTDSTDGELADTQQSAWAEDQLGTVWWDTSTVRYFDYYQEDVLNAQSANFWGKQVDGSSVDVYEWTMSTVPPEEWKNQVKQKIEQFGEVASGEAYRVTNEETNEQVYYYTESEKYNTALKRNDIVYFFWVKNKTTVSDVNKSLTTLQIAGLINDPSGNGISWCAMNDTNSLLLGNADHYISNDNMVVQINILPYDQEHNSWTAIRYNIDVIPDYWFTGTRDNLVGKQTGTDILWPNWKLHEFSRYGDDRKLGQGWFTNTFDARREAITSANMLLKHMNLVDDLPTFWNRLLTGRIYQVAYTTPANNTKQYRSLRLTKKDYNKFINGTVTIDDYKLDGELTLEFLAHHPIDHTQDIAHAIVAADLNECWRYTDYEHAELYQPEKQPTLEINDKLALDDIKYDDYVIVREYDVDGLDKSEYYLRLNGEWTLIKKRNATIEFTDLVWNKQGNASWDGAPWDSVAWDIDTGIYMYNIIEALRYDLFIEKYIENFNRWFFSVINHVFECQDYVDWCYKTTYITLHVDSDIDLTARRYRDTVNEGVIGFVNQVKPFHTKIKTLHDKRNYNESVTVIPEELGYDWEIKPKHLDEVNVSAEETNIIRLDVNWNDSVDIETEETLSLARTEIGSIYTVNEFEDTTEVTELPDQTPAPRTETFIAETGQIVYTLVNTLSDTTWSVSTVSHNGVVLQHYFDLFNELTITEYTNPITSIQAGDTIEITLEHNIATRTVVTRNYTDTTQRDIVTVITMYDNEGNSTEENVTVPEILDIQTRSEVLSDETVGGLVSVSDLFASSIITDIDGVVEEILTPNGTMILHVYDTDKFYQLTHDRTGVGTALEEVLLSGETAAGDNSIFVYDSDFNIPTQGYMYMNGEIWYYEDRISNLVFNNVQRGQLGTVAKDHAYPPAAGEGYTKAYYISDMELNIEPDGSITNILTGDQLVIE